MSVTSGGEHAIRLGRRQATGEELLDLVEDAVLIAHPRQVVVARQLDELRARDLARDPAPLLDVRVQVASVVHDQRRHADRRQEGAVYFGVHPKERMASPGLALCRK
jgi:hypothetical protein